MRSPLFQYRFPGEKPVFEKKRVFFYIPAATIVVIATCAVLYHRRDLKIPEFSLQPSGRAVENQVGCLLVAKIGDRDLRIGFVMPTEDRHDREALLEKLPVIKHELLMSSDRPELVHSLEQRDFDAIRDHLLNVINRYSSRPVVKLFFESYFFD